MLKLIGTVVTVVAGMILIDRLMDAAAHMGKCPVCDRG